MSTFDRVYRSILDRLTDWFRVPDKPPEPPMARPDEESDSFRPAEGFMRYMKFWFWVLWSIKNLGIFAGLLVMSTAHQIPQWRLVKS